jgi:phospholipid/cholesterol/gamma-HCH transport system substrate-binding protein
VEENSSRQTEIKVGIFTLIGLALVVALGIFIADIDLSGNRGYTLQVFFKTADGLGVGNQVRYAGIRAGKVEKIELMPHGISVTLKMDPGVKVPKGSIVSLGTEGLVGSKYVAIQPPEEVSQEFLPPDSKLIGTSPPSIDDMMASATRLVGQLEQTVGNVNEIAGSEETKIAIKTAIKNIGLITDNLRMATESLNRMSTGSEGDMRAIVQNLRATSDDMRQVVGTANRMLTTVDDNGKGAEDIRQMLTDMKSIVHRMDKIAASVEGLATDPDTISDVKATIRNASETSAKINRLLGGNQSTGSDKVDKGSGTEKKKTSSRSFFEGGAEMSYSADEKDWRGDANISIGGDRYVRIGAQDIGEDNHFELQGGTWKGPIGFRAGVFESRLGVGVDWQASKRFKVSVDGYDPNDFKYRVRGEYDVTDSTSVFGQFYGKDRSSSTYFGIRQRF